MKSSDFIKKIKEIIAEEVRVAVRTEMRGIREEVKSALNELINENKKVDHKKVMEVGMQNYKQKPSNKSKKVYHKDPLMQSILEETANSMVNENIEEEWPTMGGRDFTSADSHLGVGGDFRSNLNSMINPQANTAVSPEVKLNKMIPKDSKHLADKIDDKTKEVLTRDYSSLMKKMAEKDKQKGRV